MYTNYKEGATDTANLDRESYLIANVGDAKDILKYVREQWNQEIEPEELYILPFKPSQLKRIKQTLELV